SSSMSSKRTVWVVTPFPLVQSHHIMRRDRRAAAIGSASERTGRSEREVRSTERYLGVRSLIETPIMDERKWAKVPSIPADAFLLDIEDSVPPASKDAARARVAAYVRDPSYFDGRLVVARVNHLSTPWGRDDIDELAGAGVTCVAYPK